MYKIKTEKFNGPLDLLLQLIEKNELEITEISLAQVTEQYLSYLEKLNIKDPEDLSDFLVVAAKLLLQKSRAILPIVETEEDYDDLEKQLKMYKEFLEASHKLESIMKTENFTFSREKSPIDIKVEFAPSENITLQNLKDNFLKILKRLDPLVKMPKKLMEKTISLQQTIFDLQKLLLKSKKTNFKDLFKTAKNKTDIILGFLAILELVKQKKLTVTQTQDDIYIENL